MKPIDNHDDLDISGGYQPSDGGCFPTPSDYPYLPLVPDPFLPQEPLPGYLQIA